MSPHADLLRGLTIHKANPEVATEPLFVDVELCPGARVYHYNFCALVIPAELAWDPDVPLAILHLQDSTIALYDGCCGDCADLPGLKWPAFAKLEIPPGVRVTLTLAYGDCA